MPVVEIDENELLRLRRLGETVSAMYKTPSAKRQLLGALKEVRPEDPAVKELDKPDPTESAIAEVRKEAADLRKQIEDDKAERENNSRLDAIKREQDTAFDALRRERWTEEGIAKVKAIMQEQGIASVAIAAKWIESQMPIQQPATPSSGGWNFMDGVSAAEGDADLRRLIETKGENEGLLRKMAGEAISEIRGQSGARR